MKISAEEKEILEEAARRINAQISQFKATYHTQDDLNIALMTCLKFAADAVRSSHQADQREAGFQEALDELETRLTGHLEKS